MKQKLVRKTYIVEIKLTYCVEITEKRYFFLFNLFCLIAGPSKKKKHQKESRVMTNWILKQYRKN